MTISHESIEEFLRSLLKYRADEYSYEEQLRHEVAAAIEPEKHYKKKNFLEV